MQRLFFQNLAFLLVLNLLVKPFWILGVNVAVQNAVGPDDYGLYFAVLNLSYIFQVVLDFGIQNFNNKTVAEDPTNYRLHLVNMAIVKFALALVYFFILFSVGNWILGYSDRMFHLLSIVGFNVFLSSFILFLRSNLAGLHLFKWDSLASVVDRILMIAICGGLLLFSKATFQIEWFAWAQTISYGVVILGVAGVLALKAGKVDWKFEKGLFWKILKLSVPFALLNFLMSAYQRIDGVMLETLLEEGTYYAGVYAQGFKVYEASTMIAFLFAGLLLPIFSKELSLNNDIRPVALLAGKVLLVPVLILVISTGFYAPAISEVLFQEAVSSTSRVLQILMFSFLPVSVGYIFSTLLTAAGDLKFLNYSSLLGLVANIGLNWWLIPEYAAFGAAISTLVTQGMVIGLQFIRAWMKYDFHISLKKLGILLAFSGLFVLLGTILTNYFGQNIIIWIGYILIGLILALSLKIVSIRETFSLLK